MSKKIGVVRFLGTNCDRDVWSAIESINRTPEWLWFNDQYDARDYAALIIPGGFSYGDYLRCGALAARAPVMKTVREAVSLGVPVLGICNGFQILCEAQLLPGALVRNSSQKFVDKWVQVSVKSQQAKWSTGLKENAKLKLPVAHGEGRYYVEESALKQLRDNNQIWMTYEDSNPNGSFFDIAGVTNQQGNVCALMPHPERAMWNWMGGEDGKKIWNCLLGWT